MRGLQSRLGVYRTLAPEEEDALASLTTHRRTAAKGETLSQGDSAHSDVHVVLEGLVQEERDFDDGVRQILALYVPGDLVGLGCLFSEAPGPTRSAVTNCSVLTIDGPDLVRLISTRPGLAVLFWRDAARVTAITREWMVSMGRRSALSRTAHLMCEMFIRMAAVTGVTGGSCAFSLTQSELADALGLSVVHVNRVLQRLRSDGLITLGGGRLVIRDWPRLVGLGAFDMGYLKPIVLPVGWWSEMEAARV